MPIENWTRIEKFKKKFSLHSGEKDEQGQILSSFWNAIRGHSSPFIDKRKRSNEYEEDDDDALRRE